MNIPLTIADHLKKINYKIILITNIMLSEEQNNIYLIRSYLFPLQRYYKTKKNMLYDNDYKCQHYIANKIHFLEVAINTLKLFNYSSRELSRRTLAVIKQNNDILLESINRTYTDHAGIIDIDQINKMNNNMNKIILYQDLKYNSIKELLDVSSQTIISEEYRIVYSF